MARKSNESQRSGAPAEWVLAALSAILVIGMLAHTVREGLSVAGPPRLIVTVDSVQPIGSEYLAFFTVRNDGGHTAAAVTIKGALQKGTAVVEESDVTIDYVPKGARRRAGLLFTRDPRSHTLRVRASGFDRP